MATNNHNSLPLPEMDHIQPNNLPHNESLPLGQKILMHHGSDAPLRIGHSSHVNMALRSNDVPSSSRAAQFSSYGVGNPGISRASYVHCPAGSSSSHLPEPTVRYPHKSEEGFAPASSHLDNKRAAMKRKNPMIDHADGINTSSYYVGNSSNTQLSNSVQPNLAQFTEPFHPQMPLSIGQSGWNGQHLIYQEEFQRNVRARNNRNISLEPTPALAYTANSIQLPPFHSTASTSLSTSVERNPTSVSVPTRTVPSGASGIARRALMSPYYPAIISNNSNVVAVPTVHGSSSSATFASGLYAPRTVHSGTVPVYSNQASAASSGSRAIPQQTVFRNYPPATSAAGQPLPTRTAASSQIGQSLPTRTAASSQIRQPLPTRTAASSQINQPLPTRTAASSQISQPLPSRTAASSRHARLSVGHASNGRNRRARSFYYGFHPLMIEAERFMMLDQLVFYESREAADPHRNMRLDVDNMSYEDLLALGEFIGTVNTGLAIEKISKCVREVVCCSSDQTLNDQDDGSCVICLEDYKDKDSLGILKCSHDFHADCIKKWLQTKNSCPVCKAAAA